MSYALAAAGMLAIAAGTLLADDWPQWRGPERNGLVPASPPLIDGFPSAGPRRLWESEKVPGATTGGWGSVSVAGGKVYVYANWKYPVPIATRTLGRPELMQMGWSAVPLPEEVTSAIETARTSEALAALVPAQREPWINEWIKTHLGDRYRQFHELARVRLRLGRQMLAPALLEKLGPIAGREFASEAELIAWLRGNQFDDQAIQAVVSRAPKTRDQANDMVLCLNAADGKTLWKYERPGRAYGWPCSSTPCIAEGRCLVQISDGYAVALDAATGQELWKVLTPARRGNETASSFVVEQGVAVLLAGPLTGFDPATGKTLWTQPRVHGDYASCAYWKTPGKTYLVCNGQDDKTYAVDPKDGRVLWAVPGGGWSTPAVVGDHMVVLTSNPKIGMVAYQLALDQPRKMWTVDQVDRGASVLIYQGAVYLFAGYGKGRGLCVDLATGQVKWEKPVGYAEFSSPIGVQDKVIAVVASSLYMIQADPSRYACLGQANLGIVTCTSPALADGILYLRLNNTIAAFDLRRHSP